MLILEIFVSIAILLMVALQVNPFSMAGFIALFLTALLVFPAIHILAGWILKLLDSFLFLGIERLSTRERKLKDVNDLLQKDETAKAEELLRRLQKDRQTRPNATLCLLDLYLREKRHRDYLREAEESLLFPVFMKWEEKCTLIHRMADLYLDKIQNVDKALLVLNQIIAEQPQSLEAAQTRRRIERITSNQESDSSE